MTNDDVAADVALVCGSGRFRAEHACDEVEVWTDMLRLEYPLQGAHTSEASPQVSPLSIRLPMHDIVMGKPAS